MKRKRLLQYAVSAFLMLAILTIPFIQFSVSGQSYTTTESLYATSFTLPAYEPPGPIVIGTVTLAMTGSGTCYDQAFPFPANKGDVIGGSVSATDQIYTAIMSSEQYSSFSNALAKGCGGLISGHSKYYRYGFTEFQWTVTASDRYYLVFMNGQPHDVRVTISVYLVTTASSQTSYTPYSYSSYSYNYASSTKTSSYQQSALSVGAGDILPYVAIVGGAAAAIALVSWIAFKTGRSHARRIRGKETMAVSNKVFCINCGKELPLESKFCNHCGTKQP
jgi:hypothetical protein